MIPGSPDLIEIFRRARLAPARVQAVQHTRPPRSPACTGRPPRSSTPSASTSSRTPHVDLVLPC